MKKLFIAVFSLTVALGLGISDAEAAKRLGGGKSVGMQREAVAPKPAAPAQAAPAPAHQPAPAAPTATQPQPKRNWLGPIAGLAAGIGLPGEVPDELSPLLEILPLQQLALHLALARGGDPDQPRGLRKVTETL